MEPRNLVVLGITNLGFSAPTLRAYLLQLNVLVSRNRSTGGSGLGLTISQRIVRRHGGELAAGNHSEGGALLTGWIPVADRLPQQRQPVERSGRFVEL